MVTALLTGFEPFAGAPTNPSWLAVQQVAEAWARPERLVTAVLPVEFGQAPTVLDELVRLHEPELVVACGVAAGRDRLTPERVAINVDDARIPDNAGRRPVDEPVMAGGPAAYFATLPLKSAVRASSEAGVPASVSDSAGTYVCNHVFYRLMDLAERRGGMRAGFVHVPPTIAPATIAVGLAAMVGACLEAPPRTGTRR